MKIVKKFLTLIIFFQLIAVVSFAYGQTSNSVFSFQINGIETGENFVFRDHNSRNHSFNKNETRNWNQFPVGSNYNLTQISGPRQCRMTNNQGVVPNSPVVVNIDCSNATSIFSFQVTGIENNETFVFRDHNSRNHSFNKNETRNWNQFAVGSNYSLNQISGSRQCRITNNQGIVPNSPVTVLIDCSIAYSNLTFQVIGIENNESFVFRDHNSRNHSFNKNEVRNWNRFIVGSNFRLTQISGSRQCKLTNNEGIVPNENVTTIIDCTKTSEMSETTAPIKFTILGVEQGESFSFKDIDNRPLTFTESTTQNIGNFRVGSNYSFLQTSGPRQCQMLQNQGTLSNSEVNILANCSKPIKEISFENTFGNFDLISRSNDKKTIGTFYGSVTPAIGGTEENGQMEGQFITYMTSWNIDPKHGGKNRQIIWFDRASGKLVVVSRGLDGIGGDKDSYNPVIDNSGRNVVFESNATNLVTGDTNKVSDIFIWNAESDSIKCLTCNGNSGSMEPTISGDGNYVVFSSNASNLTEGVDGNFVANVYLKDLRTGEITLLSKDPKTGKGVGGRHPSISEDGSRVAFYSASDKLVSGDTNNLWDIFIWERGNSQLKRVSLTANGVERDRGSESASRIVKPTISGNGKYVAYSTTASNMFSNRTDKTQNVYVVEIDSGRVFRASEGVEKAIGDADSPIEQGEKISLSYDGKWIAFTTKASNLGNKIVVKNIETGEIIPFVTNVLNGVGTPAFSRNGKCIVFPASENLDKNFASSGIFVACR